MLNERASITAFKRSPKYRMYAMTSDGKNMRKKPSGLELTGRDSGHSLRNNVHRHHILTRELTSTQREIVHV